MTNSTIKQQLRPKTIKWIFANNLLLLAYVAAISLLMDTTTNVFDASIKLGLVANVTLTILLILRDMRRYRNQSTKTQ